ncbi:MAG: site-specific integrase [Mariniphaga sp.]
MASISRRLVKSSIEGGFHLKLVVKNGRTQRWDLTTRIILPKAYWSQDKRVQRNHPDYGRYNEFIDRMEALVKLKAIELFKVEDISESVVFKTLNNVVLSCGSIEVVEVPETNDEYIGFYAFAEQFIKESAATKAPGTIMTYKQALNRLRVFDPTLDFDDFDLNFYYKFLAHLKEVGITNNTMGKHIKVLKTILNEATERGLNTNLEFRKRKFKVFKEEVDSVYLSEEELDTLFDYREHLTEAKRRICDFFLVGCYTGLRFSDIANLTTANFYKDITGSYILMRTKKTGQQVVIPLNSRIKEILNYYGGKMPQAISNQKTNDALKVICEKAGITKEVETKKRIGGETIIQVWKKCELISTHTARRSFATNAFLAGIPALSIMKITGHRAEKSFMQYVKASVMENAMVLAQHPFFK